MGTALRPTKLIGGSRDLDVEIDAYRDTCCAVGCDADSVIASDELPLCERHLILSYRQSGEYISSREAALRQANPTK